MNKSDIWLVIISHHRKTNLLLLARDGIFFNFYDVIIHTLNPDYCISVIPKFCLGKSHPSCLIFSFFPSQSFLYKTNFSHLCVRFVILLFLICQLLEEWGCETLSALYLAFHTKTKVGPDNGQLFQQEKLTCCTSLMIWDWSQDFSVESEKWFHGIFLWPLHVHCSMYSHVIHRHTHTESVLNKLWRHKWSHRHETIARIYDYMKQYRNSDAINTVLSWNIIKMLSHIIEGMFVPLYKYMG